MATSRPYKVKVRESLQRTVVAEDHLSTTLETPPILPPERTARVVDRIFREHGFTDNGEGTLTREQGGVEVEVDPSTGNVTVSVEASSDVEVEDDGRGGGGGCPCYERSKEMVRQALNEKLNKASQVRQSALQERVTEKLEEALGALGCELETIANQVTSAALVERARELGEIKKIHRDNETGQMTVVVEVAG